MGVGGQLHVLCFTPGQETWYLFCRRLGGPQGQFGWVQKILPPSGFVLRTVESLYLEVVCYIKVTMIHCSIIYKFITAIHEESWIHMFTFSTQAFSGKVCWILALDCYMKVPDHKKKGGGGRIKSFKRELKSLLLHPAYYSFDKFMVYWLCMDCWVMWVW